MPTPARASNRPGDALLPHTATARVADMRPVAEDVLMLQLVSPHGQRLPDWTPGAHIDVVLPNGTIRQYSLCGDRWDPWSYRIAVLREPAGRGGSAYIHDQLGVGAVVGVGGPRNNFPLAPSDHYLFVAGGIGITPIVPMLQQAELLGADWHLLYGGRRRASMAFLDDLSAYGDRVRIAPQDEFGLLDLSGFLGSPRPGVQIYACGPSPLLAAIERACDAWPTECLRTERFSAKEAAGSALNTAFEVELERTGITVNVPPDKSILEAVSAAGVEVLSSCRQGICGTCETTVLSGEPDHRDAILEDHEREVNDCMFPCVSRSRTSRIVLDL